MWQWQGIGTVQAFQLTVSNGGSMSGPLSLADIAQQDIMVDTPKFVQAPNSAM